MGKLGNGTGLVVVLLIICSVIPAVPAAVYTVGDASGWSIGADYTTWTSDKTFALGDTLVFNYPPGHTVDEVSANDYKTCTVGNAIASDSSGATSVSLKTAGPHYFICGVPGHCGGGMKLAITVASAATGGGGGTTTSPSTTTSPPTTTTLAPPTGVAGGAMNEPYSSSTKFSPSVVSVSIFCVFVGFMYLV